MTHIIRAVPRGVCALLIGCSTAALLAPAAARAACSPNPTQEAQRTVCDGVETAGLVVGTRGAEVTVNAAAVVTGPGGIPAIQVTASPMSGSYLSRAATISVDGRVDGGSAAGILVAPGAPGPNDYYGSVAETAISIGAAGAVTGVNGISLAPNPASPYALGRVTLSNSGIVTGTGGVALFGSDPSIGSFAIVNTSTGTIGAIYASVTSLDNSGVIDGGIQSALATPATSSYYSGYTTVTNSGTIRSASTASTIALRADFSYPGVNNSGTIANAGSGAAISSTGSIGLTNARGSSITSVGAIALDAATTINVTNDGTISAAATAINAAGTVRLTNHGAITGDIRGGGGFYDGSSIDTSGGGTIAGNVFLGGGDDTVAVDYSASQIFTGISGIVDAGGGSNTLRLSFATDTTLNTPAVLPATFQ